MLDLSANFPKLLSPLCPWVTFQLGYVWVELSECACSENRKLFLWESAGRGQSPDRSCYSVMTLLQSMISPLLKSSPLMVTPYTMNVSTVYQRENTKQAGKRLHAPIEENVFNPAFSSVHHSKQELTFLNIFYACNWLTLM